MFDPSKNIKKTSSTCIQIDHLPVVVWWKMYVKCAVPPPPAPASWGYGWGRRKLPPTWAHWSYGGSKENTYRIKYAVIENNRINIRTGVEYDVYNYTLQLSTETMPTVVSYLTLKWFVPNCEMNARTWFTARFLAGLCEMTRKRLALNDCYLDKNPHWKHSYSSAYCSNTNIIQ